MTRDSKVATRQLSARICCRITPAWLTSCVYTSGCGTATWRWSSRAYAIAPTVRQSV